GEPLQAWELHAAIATARHQQVDGHRRARHGYCELAGAGTYIGGNDGEVSGHFTEKLELFDPVDAQSAQTGSRLRREQVRRPRDDAVDMLEQVRRPSAANADDGARDGA